MILFLNKKDLFEAKVMKVPIKATFPDYTGPEKDFAAGVQFFQNEFTSKIADGSKEIYVHVTCATDTDNVKVVFEACKDTILKANLLDSGFAF